MALCRFKLKDEDFEELKKKCKEEKLILSDVLRDMVATFIGRKVEVRTYNRGHELDTDIVATNSNINGGHELDDVNGGHELIEQMMATNRYPIFNDDGTIKGWSY